MKPEIHRIALGFCNCYLIKDEGMVLVDAGQPTQWKRFVGRLRESSLDAKHISLIFLTHGHYDHIGLLADLKGVANCPVAINWREKPWVEEGLAPTPPGVDLLGKVSRSVLKAIRRRLCAASWSACESGARG